MIEIWPLWWVDRALTAFSAIMDFESTISRSIFIRKKIRHSFNYLLMLYVSYNLHESKEVLFVFHPLPNSFQVENSRKIHANPQPHMFQSNHAVHCHHRLSHWKYAQKRQSELGCSYKRRELIQMVSVQRTAHWKWRCKFCMTQRNCFDTRCKIGSFDLIWCRAVRTLPFPEAECSWFRWTVWPEEYSREDFLWS